ncbi:hypothetical protein SAMN05216354_0623 [Xylanibacter ruminicola]|uniref:Homeodomain-like domain-containing protein n=1 Tax=Xylanibacter ruminicola TaxID=839 RepID=A0A1H5SF47_XYLRU|nr:hypothetical protein [Xylanibacter ruminicola]SEF48377.1 hypothetical protein SAMN05216354_0623 [Xylanibacter ruminicola]
MKKRQVRRGVSYQKRVEDINRIYDQHRRSGLTNAEIWRRYIYPRFGISQRTLYNILSAPAKESSQVPKEMWLFLDFED